MALSMRKEKMKSRSVSNQPAWDDNCRYRAWRGSIRKHYCSLALCSIMLVSGMIWSWDRESVWNVLISQRIASTKNDFGKLLSYERCGIEFLWLVTWAIVQHFRSACTAYCNRVPHVVEMLKKWMLCGDVMPFIATTSQSLWSNHERIALIYFTSIPMNEYHHAPHHISICIVIYSRSLSFIGLRWVNVRCVVTITFCFDDDCNSRVHSVRMFLRSGKTYKYSIRQHTHTVDTAHNYLLSCRDVDVVIIAHQTNGCAVIYNFLHITNSSKRKWMKRNMWVWDVCAWAWWKERERWSRK